MNRAGRSDLQESNVHSDAEIESELFEVADGGDALATNWYMAAGGVLILAGFIYVLTGFGLFAGTVLATIAVLLPWLAIMIMLVTAARILLPRRNNRSA